MKRLLILLLFIGLPCYSMELQEFETLYDNTQQSVIDSWNKEPENKYQRKVICDECITTCLEPNYKEFIKIAPNKQWKEYLKLRHQQQKWSKYNGAYFSFYYYNEYLIMPYKKLFILLDKEENFIRENYKFSHIQEAKDLYKKHFLAIFLNSGIVDYTYGLDASVSWYKKEYINNLEYYLNHKEMDREYIIIEDWYNLLKKNNFRQTDEVIKELNRILDNYKVDCFN